MLEIISNSLLLSCVRNEVEGLGSSCQQYVEVVTVRCCGSRAFKQKHQDLWSMCLWLVPDAIHSGYPSSCFQWTIFFMKLMMFPSLVITLMLKRSYGCNQFFSMKNFVSSLSRSINKNPWNAILPSYRHQLSQKTQIIIQIEEHSRNAYSSFIQKSKKYATSPHNCGKLNHFRKSINFKKTNYNL